MLFWRFWFDRQGPFHQWSLHCYVEHLLQVAHLLLVCAEVQTSKFSSRFHQSLQIPMVQLQEEMQTDHEVSIRYIFEKRFLLLSIDITLFLILQVHVFLMVSNVKVFLPLLGSKNDTIFAGWSRSLIHLPISFIPLILASNMLAAAFSLTIVPAEIEVAFRSMSEWKHL